MPVKPASTSNVETATGRPPEAWFAWLDRNKARDLPHADIVKLLRRTGEVPPWWSQMLTVAYEQHIGRRTPGQDCTGKFRASASRGMEGSMDDVLARWVKAMGKRREFSGVTVASKPETSSTPNWRYWRCTLGDGTKIAVNISEAAGGKSRLAIQHEKLESADAVEHWKAFWKAELAAL